MQLSRACIVAIWIQLFACANLELCCNKLTSIGALDYVFDVIRYFIDRKELYQSSGNCSELIIEGFKEALESNQFKIAIKLMHDYEYILQINQSKVSQSLVNSIHDGPYFMEVKLRLVEQSVRMMDFDSMKKLLAAFEKLVKQV